MTNMIFYIAMIGLILILKNIFDFFMLGVHQRRRRKLWTALIGMEALVLKTEIALIDEALEDTPLLKKRYKKFLEFYEHYSSRKDKILKLSMLLFLLCRIDLDKERSEFNSLQQELKNAADKRIVEIYSSHIELLTDILRISMPRKFEICLWIANLKVKVHLLKEKLSTLEKNNLRQNLAVVKKLPAFGKALIFRDKKETESVFYNTFQILST